MKGHFQCKFFAVACCVYNHLTSNSHIEIAMFSGYSFHIICMSLFCSGGKALSVILSTGISYQGNLFVAQQAADSHTGGV